MCCRLINHIAVLQKSELILFRDRIITMEICEDPWEKMRNESIREINKTIFPISPDDRGVMIMNFNIYPLRTIHYSWQVENENTVVLINIIACYCTSGGGQMIQKVLLFIDDIMADEVKQITAFSQPYNKVGRLLNEPDPLSGNNSDFIIDKYAIEFIRRQIEFTMKDESNTGDAYAVYDEENRCDGNQNQPGITYAQRSYMEREYIANVTRVDEETRNMLRSIS